MLTNKLLDTKIITVTANLCLEDRSYELRDRGTHFSIYYDEVNGIKLDARFDVSVGKEAYIRGKWAKLK